MKDLQSKEPYCYKIHALLMKSSALHPSIDNPFVWVKGFTLLILQCKVGLVYKVLYIRMLILIFLVYVLSGYIAITAIYRWFLGTCTECEKQHINSMSQLLKIIQTSCFATFGSSACQGGFSWHVHLECFRDSCKIKSL